MAIKKVKGVSFNLETEHDKKLYKFILRKNFSGYVKKLIEADFQMKKGAVEKPKKEHKKEPEEEVIRQEVVQEQQTKKSNIRRPANRDNYNPSPFMPKH
jgi:hypothetical protein